MTLLFTNFIIFHRFLLFSFFLKFILLDFMTVFNEGYLFAKYKISLTFEKKTSYFQLRCNNVIHIFRLLSDLLVRLFFLILICPKIYFHLFLKRQLKKRNMKRNIRTKITSVSRNRVLHKYFLILDLTFRSNLINNSLYNSLISSPVSKRVLFVSFTKRI